MPCRASGENPSERNAQAEVDRRDARLLLELLIEDRFPEIWMPLIGERDLRTLLRDRHQWVKMRARLQHTLQAIALNHALRQGHALWSQTGQSALEALPLPPCTNQRRTELLSLYEQLQKRIQKRLGKLTKQGNSLLRYLWTEATMHAVRKDRLALAGL